MSQEILKVKLTDDGVDIEFTDTKVVKKDERLEAALIAKCKWRMHKDFKEHLDYLRVHLALATEQIDKYTQAKKYLEPFKVTGYTMGTDGVTLIGQRRLKNGQVLNITTFFIKFDDQDAYWECYELAECIQNCNKEAKLYLGGKRGINPQTSMDFGEGEGHSAKVVKVITQPKRLNGPNKQIGNG